MPTQTLKFSLQKYAVHEVIPAVGCTLTITKPRVSDPPSPKDKVDYVDQPDGKNYFLVRNNSTSNVNVEVEHTTP